MNRIKVAGLAVLFAVPVLCAAETWTDVPIVDVSCSAKVKANPDAHTRDCALQCSKSGYVIITSDGTVLKLDSKGNQEAIVALKASASKDHLRATVTGEREGDTIKVKSLKI
jgi:hypothetical protein